MPGLHPRHVPVAEIGARIDASPRDRDDGMAGLTCRRDGGAGRSCSPDPRRRQSGCGLPTVKPLTVKGVGATGERLLGFACWSVLVWAPVTAPRHRNATSPVGVMPR